MGCIETRMGRSTGGGLQASLGQGGEGEARLTSHGPSHPLTSKAA